MATKNPKVPLRESVPYAVNMVDDHGKHLTLLTGDSIVVRASNPAVTVVPDATPMPDTLASGRLVASDQATGDVAIQATLTHADGSVAHAVAVVDIGDPPPPPEIHLVPEPVRNLVITVKVPEVEKAPRTRTAT